MSYGPKGPSRKQRAAIRHNSLIGLSVAIQRHAHTIEAAETSSNVARSWAATILNDAKSLEQALRAERKDS